MSLYTLKPRFQNLLRPLTRWLAAHGVTANQVTLAAAAGSMAIGALAGSFAGMTNRLFLLIPVWLFVRMALNAIDGMLAREHGQKSTLGAYLNELGDVISDIALALPFLAWPVFSSADVWLFALAAAVVECAGLIGPLAGASRRYDGPFGKSDRALALGAFALWYGVGLPVAGVGGGGAGGIGSGGGVADVIALWLWRALIALSLVTIVQRVRAGIAQAGSGGG